MFKLSKILFTEETVETVSQASSLALAKLDPYLGSYGDEIGFVLYKKEQHKFPDIIAAVTITIQPSCNNKYHKIERAAADHGYGPFIYEVALSEYPLIPDFEISTEAQRVWIKFFNREDIEAVSVQDMQDKNGCDFYKGIYFKHVESNFKYLDGYVPHGVQLKNPIDVSELYRRHHMNVVHGLVSEKKLTTLTEEFFHKRIP